jgi:hypothetical protein
MRWRRKEKIAMIIIKGKFGSDEKYFSFFRRARKNSESLLNLSSLYGRVLAMKGNYSKQKFLLLAYYSFFIRQSKY